MAFEFQINRDIKFNRDNYLLNKAEEFKPNILPRTVSSYRLVELLEDKSKFEGVGINEIDGDLNEKALNKGDSLIIDFKNHHVGKFSINIESIGSPMDAPLYIRLRFAEVAAELKYRSEDYDGWLSSSWIQEEFIHLDELPCLLELPRRYAFRFVEIKVIDTSPKWSAVFKNPQVVTETSANSESIKIPELNDPILEKIYEVSVKTLEDCMTDVFEDGPKRDRRLWLGDLRLQALANYKTFNRYELVKRCLYLFAGMTVEDGRISANVFTKPFPQPDDTFLFEYSLFFGVCLYDYLNEDYDIKLLEDLYPIAKKQMDYSIKYVSEDGLLLTDDKYPIFVDWSNEFDKTTSGQAIMIYSLKKFISLAKLAGDDYSKYQNILDKLINYSKDKLFNSDKKLFVSGENEYNIASQVWMILAGVFDNDKNKEIMKEIINSLFPVKNIATPYMYHHIAEAMFVSGLEEEAVSFVKGYWGKMIDLGADTFWEAFDPNNQDYSPYGSPIISSFCHAWSCTPVYLIEEYLL